MTTFARNTVLQAILVCAMISAAFGENTCKDAPGGEIKDEEGCLSACIAMSCTSAEFTEIFLISKDCKCQGCPSALGTDVGCKDESYVLVIIIIVGVCLLCCALGAMWRFCCQKKSVSA